MILIIGAGLTGLSLSRGLGNTEHLLFEKEPEAGGLCRSHNVGGFTFDYSGHFLHLKNPRKAGVLKRKFGVTLKRFTRDAAIHMEGRMIDYPFQANLFGLKKNTIKECLDGLRPIYASLRAQSLGAGEIFTAEKNVQPEADLCLPSRDTMQVSEISQRGKHCVQLQAGLKLPANYSEWLKSTFGPGMAKHFFYPYNRKFWKTDLRKIVPDFAAWSIPRPSLEEVENGAKGIKNDPMGYNQQFFYPSASRGIGALPRAMAKGLKQLNKNEAVVKIKAGDKKLATSKGRTITYDRLVSTIPLTNLVAIIDDAPSSVKKAANKLNYISVDCINLGFKRKDIFPWNWVYFPERKYKFFRVGSYSEVMTEPGTALYVEFSRGRNASKGAKKELLAMALEGLRKSGLISQKERPVVHELLRMEPAYVIHDSSREKSLKVINEWLSRKRIHSIGRYGAWKYSTMEAALDDGHCWAQKLLKN